MLTRSQILKSDILNFITCPSSSSKEAEVVSSATSSDPSEVAFFIDNEHLFLEHSFRREESHLPIKGKELGLISLVDKLEQRIGTSTPSQPGHQPTPHNAIGI